MTTPLILESDDTDLLWKKLDAKKAEGQAKQTAQDVIVADADSLISDSYYDRLRSIQDRSSSATQGAIAAENTRKQMEAARQAAEMQRKQQEALQQAYNGMNQIAGGAGFGQLAGQGYSGGGNWGSGGAQGVANVLRQAGFPESAVPTMMAIAMAESSWNPGATHKNSNGSIDQGLFQINSIHRGNSWYPSNPMDPLQSAQAAFALWKGAGGSYRDWTVYNSGAYRKFLQAAPPIQPYVANTSQGMMYAQVGQAQVYGGVPAIYNNGNYGPTNSRGLAGNASAARDFVRKTFGITNIGGFGGGSVSGSDHPRGKALDIMIPDYRSSGGISKGTTIANWFIQNPRVFGVKYIIWRDRIWQNGVWKSYGHPTMHNDTGQHRDHVHVSFL